MNIDVRLEEAAVASVGKVFSPDIVQRAVKAVLEDYPEINQPALTVLVTVDKEIRSLNERFMGIDAPTDVLSFPSGELTEFGEEETYLGDIMISLETAARQAAQGGHSLAQEVELLSVHGALHLLGYDHGDEDEKRQMWGAQATILEKLANPLAPP